MKIVLDMNVLISVIFFSGPPYQILKAWQKGKISIVASKEIILEYQRVAHELSEKYPLINFEQILQLVTIYAEIVNTKMKSLFVKTRMITCLYHVRLLVKATVNPCCKSAPHHMF